MRVLACLVDHPDGSRSPSSTTRVTSAVPETRASSAMGRTTRRSWSSFSIGRPNRDDAARSSRRGGRGHVRGYNTTHRPTPYRPAYSAPAHDVQGQIQPRGRPARCEHRQMKSSSYVRGCRSDSGAKPAGTLRNFGDTPTDRRGRSMGGWRAWCAARLEGSGCEASTSAAGVARGRHDQKV